MNPSVGPIKLLIADDHPVVRDGLSSMFACDPEFEVLELVAAGATNREAAARLFISEATVKSHLMNIYAKLGVSDRAAAVGEAFNRGLLTPEAPEG